MNALVVIVTGANNGIGLHLTKSLLENGHCVAGIDLNGDNLTPLEEHYTGRLRFYSCDVVDTTQVSTAVESILHAWKRIDVLVNNAALAIFGPFDEKRLDATRKEFEVNYFGYIHMIQAVLPHLKARRNGLIHNVSSGVGITGFPGLYGYSSTKGAIEALTRTLAMELEPYGITVNLVHPPLTNTRSAAPLGIPPRMMADPVAVGSKLAKQIQSKKPIVTPDFRTAVGLFVSHLFPTATGKLLARLTQRARSSHAKG